jgi:hypothetical protein
MAILFFINKFTNCQWSAEKINGFYKAMVHLGYVDADSDFTRVDVDDATIINPERIFRMKGLIVNYNDRHDPPDYVCGGNEFEILKFVNGSMGHFVCGDGNGNVTYDPWGESATVAFGKLQSKRIFKRLS